MQPFIKPTMPGNDSMSAMSLKNDKEHAEFWEYKGEKVKLNPAKTIATKSHKYGYNAVFGSMRVNKGRHIWKLKVLFLTQKMCIGVSSSIITIDMNFHKQTSYPHYGYTSNGMKVSQKTDYATYGLPIKSGQMITIILDLNKRYIAFMNNRNDLGIAFKKIKVSHDLYYRIAVSILNKNDSIKIIGYTHYDDEEKDTENDDSDDDDDDDDDYEDYDDMDYKQQMQQLDVKQIKSWNNNTVKRFVRNVVSKPLNNINGNNLNDLCKEIEQSEQNAGSLGIDTNGNGMRQQNDIRTLTLVFMVSTFMTYVFVHICDALFP